MRGVWAVVGIIALTAGALWVYGYLNRPASHDLIVGGDVMLGRDVEVWRGEGIDSFRGIRPLLTAADQVVVNLEAPLTGETEAVDKAIVLKADPSAVSVLTDAPVSAVLLANNHTFDFGFAGFLDTKDALDDAGIGFTGAGEDEEEATKPLLLEIDGDLVAIVAFSKWATDDVPAASTSPGQASYRVSSVEAVVGQARKQADLVIASFHFGREYFLTPTDEQRQVARATIDAGADMVIGRHPHVTQPMEIYRGAPISYSLGNLVFDQETPPRDRSFLLGIDRSADRLVVTLYPYWIRRGEVTPMTSEEGREFLTPIAHRSPEGAFAITSEWTGRVDLPRR